MYAYDKQVIILVMGDMILSSSLVHDITLIDKNQITHYPRDNLLIFTFCNNDLFTSGLLPLLPFFVHW